MFAASRIPAPLAHGSVRARHVVFLYAVIFVTTAIVGTKLGRLADPGMRLAWESFACQLVAAALVLVVALVVPELRRSIPLLYAHGPGLPTPLDGVAFLAMMFTWIFGVHRLLVFFPILHAHPERFATLGYFENLPSVGAAYLMVWTVASGVVAPLLEELVFRGFLQNLWQARWGVWPGILLSAFAFALAHLPYGLYAFGAGIFLSLVYLKYGSLRPGTFLHGLYNLLSSPFALGQAFLAKSPAHVGELSAWRPEIALALAFVPVLVFFWRRFRPTA